MAWVVTGAVVGNLASGLMSSGAASSAADKQAAAADRATELQREMFQTQRADADPYRRAGYTALRGLGNADFQRDFTMDDFQKDPGYSFRMQEGQKALERSAAARGGLNSGATLKALSRYGQDYATNEFQRARDNFNADRDRRFNRLSSLAGVGQTATTQVAQAGQNYANNAGNNMMGAANAAGAAGIASANAWGNTLSGLGKTWMDYSMMNKMGVK